MPVERIGLVPFEVRKEPWNEYKIKDKEDVVLRGRFIVTKFVRIRDTESPKRIGLQVGSTPIWVTYSPPGIRDKPSERLPPVNEIKEEEKKNMEVEIVKEDWNIYRIPEDNRILRFRLIVARVFRVLGYFSSDEEPYYIVESTGLLEESKED